MYTLIFIAAVTVSTVLERQERRHRAERNRECQRHGLTMPEPRPRIPTLESISTIVLGLLLFLGCAALAITTLNTFRDLGDHAQIIASDIEIPSVGIATGIAMMILGTISLNRNILYRRRQRIR